ncbi:protein phosphatase 2C domain-containing protein [Streptomyces sp. NPDC052016]|uniref:protein phosphatase 2C domain-containing protein n=1 Tax=Streptomyces sp. NPDC052016 TaxID=3365680 RepID=UPI0037D73722
MPSIPPPRSGAPGGRAEDPTLAPGTGPVGEGRVDPSGRRDTGPADAPAPVSDTAGTPPAPASDTAGTPQAVPADAPAAASDTAGTPPAPVSDTAGTPQAVPADAPAPVSDTAGTPPTAPADARPRAHRRAPWEPPPATPPGPTTFPPDPLPPGFDRRNARRPSSPADPHGRTPHGRTPTETAPTPSVPASRTPTDALSARPAEPPTPPPPPGPPPATPPPPPRAPSGSTTSATGTAAPFGGTAPAPAPRHTARPTAPPHVGSRPPTYDAEPTALPPADPDELDDLVSDTVLDGARYGACLLRAASVRGDSARYRGEPRRDSLLTARFGAGEQALILVAMATGARATPGAHRAAAEVCRWIGRAVGRSHVRLAEDIRAARRGDLKSGLHRLTDRSLGRLRAGAAEQGLEPEEYSATLRCLLLPADPACRIRVFFGVGPGGLFRLRDGHWQDIEPGVGEVVGEPVVGFGSPPSETPEGDRLTMDLGIPIPPSPYEPAPEPPREPFRFRASVARPGDTLLMCTDGLADPLRGEPELPAHLAERWSQPTPPGLAAFLADVQVRVKGYADDRTAAAVWEA